MIFIKDILTRILYSVLPCHTFLLNLVSPIRAHLVEIQVPDNEDEMHDALLQLHAMLKEKLESHIDANGHTIIEHNPNRILGVGQRYATLLGETGATYYLRRRYNPGKCRKL